MSGFFGKSHFAVFAQRDFTYRPVSMTVFDFSSRMHMSTGTSAGISPGPAPFTQGQ